MFLDTVFTESVKRFPEYIAIVEESGEQWSYRRLNRLANQFAQTFLTYKKNRRLHPYVGIFCDVHPYSIAAVLGALKVGCAYVPLDPQSPIERLRSMIESTQLDVLVLDGYLQEKANSFSSCLRLNSKAALPTTEEEPPQPHRVSDDLAYILHSSGSTGVPKGIMLSHRNARTFVDWMTKAFSVKEDDVVMSRAPFKFDLSVFDLFATFKAGAKLVCFDWRLSREEESKHRAYVRLMEKEKATILYTTPSTLIALMNRGGLGERSNDLRRVMYAGEPFPVPQLRRLMQRIPNASFANIYGPTETNIITHYEIPHPPEESDPPIPLGVEVDDTEIIVVNDAGDSLCRAGEVGELWCRGGTVTWGYLGRPEETAFCRVNSPFHPYPTIFWKTGDYGYRDEKGYLHYRGRRDHLVKVKGYRIELGEIEQALSRFSGIDEFCVVTAPDADWGNRLYGYYSTLDNKPVLPEEIVAFLLTLLPSYMIPSEWIQRQTLPKTSSGKVDRVLLAHEIERSVHHAP